LANVPGQLVIAPHGDEMGYFPRAGARPLLEHGRPFVYLRRSDEFPSHVSVGSAPVWPNVGNFTEIRWPPLVADLLVAAIVLVASILLFQAWRRRRTFLWRFSLRELLIATAVVGIVTYAVHARRKEHIEEAKTLQLLTGDSYYKSQPAGPTWLRAAIGEKPFCDFDYAVYVWASGSDLETVARLPRLKCLVVDEYYTKNHQSPVGMACRLPESRRAQLVGRRVRIGRRLLSPSADDETARTFHAPDGLSRRRLGEVDATEKTRPLRY
jgi:hypothetical protein